MEKVIGSIYQAITSTRRNQKTALGLQRKLLELFAVAAAVAVSQYTYMLEGKTITVAEYSWFIANNFVIGVFCTLLMFTDKRQIN